MSKDTADVVAPSGSQFTLTVSSGNVRHAKLESASQADQDLAVNSNVVTVPSVPAGDSQVELQIIFAPEDPDATISASAPATAVDPPPTIESANPIAYVALFGESA
jgi:hypothetical protein